ncbi:hypothetical protein ABH15_07750 [Methanoculleus taiwanensis]|uniref:DUF4935 domain-containing protein n=1 Tax=Methanoculleus taiwanensis TaxID=1550565 RepID=A0A498GZI8_9EURY|nr:PIN domain-containing protein [Methanoculleus taiwanensis]RXE56071.1 hypothetical protein ABH15_07750 [Methanoculleus taiwanensis]
MTKVFIDTNLFLGLYWSDEDTGQIFGDIETLKPHLIFPDLVFDEYLRNRDRILDVHSRQIRKTEIGELNPPFVVREQPDFARLLRIGEEYDSALQSLVSDIEGMIANPSGDPIYAAFSRLVDDPGVTIIRRTEEHVERAHRRKLLGNPPKSEKKDTIGDELIWEMILGHTADDLIFITRDATYRNHITFLTTEYGRVTGHALTIDGNISFALEQVGKEPSEALLRLEGERFESTG